MCIGGGPRGPAVDPAAEAEQKRAKEAAEQTARERRAETTMETAEMQRGGTGRRSLITGSGGGAGYFSRYR